MPALDKNQMGQEEMNIDKHKIIILTGFEKLCVQVNTLPDDL